MTIKYFVNIDGKKYQMPWMIPGLTRLPGTEYGGDIEVTF
jgi:hypothetical protein